MTKFILFHSGIPIHYIDIPENLVYSYEKVRESCWKNLNREIIQIVIIVFRKQNEKMVFVYPMSFQGSRSGVEKSQLLGTQRLRFLRSLTLGRNDIFFKFQFVDSLRKADRLNSD